MNTFLTTSSQTVQPGAAIVFQQQGNTVCTKCCPSICKGMHRVRLDFAAAIGANAATTQASVQIQNGGTAVPGGTYVVTTVAANDLNEVSGATTTKVCCNNLNNLSVVNVGTTPITVSAGAILMISSV